jgi:hypothetical protein
MAVEALYASNTNPIINLMALEGIRALAKALPAIVASPSDKAARTSAQYGAWLCGTCLGAVGMARKWPNVFSSIQIHKSVQYTTSSATPWVEVLIYLMRRPTRLSVRRLSSALITLLIFINDNRYFPMHYPTMPLRFPLS